MPTGYTAELYEGDQEFPDFVMRCARAFGAMVSMRDEPLDAEVPDSFQPSTWHEQRLAAARARLAGVRAWTPEEADRQAAEAYGSAMADWRASVRVRSERVDRYRAMLTRVEAWQPPTPDHLGLHKFMIEQLTESIDFDGHIPQRPPAWSGEEFKARQIKAAEHDVAYYTTSVEEDRQRAAERSEWLAALRASLEEPDEQG